MFGYMIVPAVPPLVVQTALDFAKPDLGALVHCALVDKRQKYLCGLIAEGTGVAEDHIHLLVPPLQNRFDLDLDGIIRLFIRPPAPSVGQPIFLIHAVRSADGKTGFPHEVIDLAIHSKQEIGILRLDKYRAAAEGLLHIIYALGLICVLAPVNADQKIGSYTYWYSDPINKYVIDRWWGQLDCAKKIMDFDGQIRVKLDFSNVFPIK
ncbi:hypothetical protein [Dysosmobacter sp.]|uniref:hypothetical protein n=1 Tax=Dysosmobacter sp. TaxID=2591382 RepID=UPI003A8F7C2A